MALMDRNRDRYDRKVYSTRLPRSPNFVQRRGVSLLHAQHRRDICAPVMLSPFVHDEGGIAGREAAPLPAAAAREVVMRM